MGGYLDLARAVPPDHWSDDDARALIGATLRRVSAAWRGLGAAERAEYAGLQAELIDKLASIETARRRRDMGGLRLALGAWERLARPLFAAARGVTC